MSGIHGVLRFDGRAVAERDIARQANALSHRGPDRRAAWRDGAVGMGHLLLRVTREDAADAQPLHSRDGAITLVADLRLDNREELAAAMAIATDELGDMPDSALALKAYEHWGASLVDHLVGDFAFAIWDARAGALLLARDPMGQRHVHYHHGKDFFAFASDVKGLWALADIPQTLDMAAVGRRLGGDRAPTRGVTSFAGVFGLEGGTVLRAAASGEVSLRRYWTPHADPRHLNKDDAYYLKTYRDVLGEAVACRVRRTRHPPALLLGGGFDSGAIAGLAGAPLAAQNRKLIGVASVLPDDGPARDVRKWTQMLARDMKHLDVRYVTREGLDIFTDMEKGFFQTGETHSASRFVNDALYAAAVAAGARVVMNGHGGDYTVNPRGTGWLARQLLRGRWRLFRSEFAAYRRHTGVSITRALRSEVAAPLVPSALMRRWRQVRAGLSAFKIPAAMTPLFLRMAAGPSGEIDRHVSIMSSEPAPLMAEVLERQRSGHVIGGALPAAAHGLEFTQPFHDKRVVELGLAIPERLYVRDGRDRHLARTALADLYPAEFQRRGRDNDDLNPDFADMAARVTPRVLSEIDRLERDENLSRYFDFARMRRMLKGDAINRKRRERARYVAIRAYLFARFIEWVQRGNRG